MYDIQSLLFPVIIWATDALGSNLTSRIVELISHSFCEKYKEKNELTKIFAKSDLFFHKFCHFILYKMMVA